MIILLPTITTPFLKSSMLTAEPSKALLSTSLTLSVLMIFVDIQPANALSSINITLFRSITSSGFLQNTLYRELLVDTSICPERNDLLSDSTYFTFGNIKFEK